MTRHQIFSVPATLPEGKRRAALDLQIRKSFPFKNPGFAAFWDGTEATVYAWDNSAVDAAKDDSGVPRNTQVVPETFMLARHSDGPQLVAMLDGFEGQFWQSGFLRASRWWPQQPSSSDWAKFLRATGHAPSATDYAPTAIKLEFLERPWTEGAFSFDDMSTVFQSPRIMAFAATAVICPFLFIGAQIAVVSFAEARIRNEIRILDRANQGVRKDRASAFANLDVIEDLLKLNEYPSQAEILSSAIKLLAEAGGSRILSWSYDRGSLEIILRGSQDLDPTAYITMFERAPGFEGVSGTFVGQERDLQLRMAVSKSALN